METQFVFVLRCDCVIFSRSKPRLKKVYLAPDESSDDYTFDIANAQRFRDSESALEAYLRIRDDGKVFLKNALYLIVPVEAETAVPA